MKSENKIKFKFFTCSTDYTFPHTLSVNACVLNVTWTLARTWKSFSSNFSFISVWKTTFEWNIWTKLQRIFHILLSLSCVLMWTRRVFCQQKKKRQRPSKTFKQWKIDNFLFRIFLWFYWRATQETSARRVNKQTTSSIRNFWDYRRFSQLPHTFALCTLTPSETFSGDWSRVCS